MQPSWATVSPVGVRTGTISAASRPASTAATAFWCEARASASWSARETLQRAATFSAVCPMGM